MSTPMRDIACNRRTSLLLSIRTWVVTFVVLLTAAVVVACSIGSDANNHGSLGDKAAVCKFYGDINSELNAADTPDDTLKVLKSFEPRYAQVLAVAPATIKPALQTMIDASQKTVESNTVGADPSGAIGQADIELTTYCGG